MTWRIHHDWLDNPCRRGSGWARDLRPGCPVVVDSALATAARDALTALVDRLGMPYRPAGGGNQWLWCLGGPGLLRDPGDLADLEHLRCIDLHLSVCEYHERISVRIDGHDLVPERGEAAAGRVADPIDLGQSAMVDDLVGRVDAWLSAVLVLPS